MYETIPHEFVLKELIDLDPEMRSMFGCLGVYVRGQIVLILRDRSDATEDNGVWLATSREHHQSLKSVFNSMRSIDLFGYGRESEWQNLPADHTEFRAEVLKACELIKQADPRIGKHPSFDPFKMVK